MTGVQTCALPILNKPYGDVWHKMRELAYTKHPYRWMTIGKELSHIENATLADVKSFFKKFYSPSNAIMVVSGNVTTEQVKELSEKWFEPIPAGTKLKRELPPEPPQTEERKQTLYSDVPVDAIYKTYHMCARNDDDYYATDLISDILSRGNSSRLYLELIKNKQLFSEINAYVMGDIDKGLFCISGKLSEGVEMSKAENAIDTEIMKLQNELVNERELKKCTNKIEASLEFSELDILSKATNLAVFELLGDASNINRESEKYVKVTPHDLQRVAREILTPSNCSTLYYLKKQN